MAAYLDNSGTLLLLYRPKSKPVIFKSALDLIRADLKVRGPVYVSDIAGWYQRLKESAPHVLQDANIKIRSAGGINNINFTYTWAGKVREHRYISASVLNMPDSLKVSDILDYIQTLRDAAGFYPYSIGAAASKYFSIHADLTPGAELSDSQRELARSSFFGGFCYLRPGVREVNGGYVYDINKLYAYILRDMPLPIGKPLEYHGDVPAESKGFYIHRFKVSAKLRAGKLPFIRLMHDWSVRNGYQTDLNDKILTLCKPDLELFKENYKISSYEPIGGLDFYACDFMYKMHVQETFDKISKTDKPGEIAAWKILINALFGSYGRRDTVGRTVYKDGTFIYEPDFSHKSNAYIPMASAIASYGRSLIIPAAQREGSNFIYSDTDSIHCFRESRYIKTSRDFGQFKLEEHFEHGRYFGRRKYVLLLSSYPERKKIVMAGLQSGALDKVPYDEIVPGLRVPMVRKFLTADGSIERVNMTYQI